MIKKQGTAVPGPIRRLGITVGLKNVAPPGGDTAGQPIGLLLALTKAS